MQHFSLYFNETLFYDTALQIFLRLGYFSFIELSPEMGFELLLNIFGRQLVSPPLNVIQH